MQYSNPSLRNKAVPLDSDSDQWNWKIAPKKVDLVFIAELY